MSHLTVNQKKNMWVNSKHLKCTEGFKVRPGPTLHDCISERKSAGFTGRQQQNSNDGGNDIFSAPANL